MTDTMLALVAAEGRGAVRAEDSLEDRCRAAMKACHRHWMVTDEDMQFRGAIAAVYESASADERERIEHELESLRDLSALLSGVPVAIEALAERAPSDPIGLRRMWMEQTTAAAPPTARSSDE